MPTIFRWRGFRFHFYSNESSEPPHVHIRKADDSCKFWLCPVSLVYNDGVTTAEVRELRQVVVEHRNEFEAKWHEYFGQ